MIQACRRRDRARFLKKVEKVTLFLPRARRTAGRQPGPGLPRLLDSRFPELVFCLFQQKLTNYYARAKNRPAKLTNYYARAKNPDFQEQEQVTGTVVRRAVSSFFVIEEASHGLGISSLREAWTSGQVTGKVAR